ncbi:glycogen debranching N-terminal domain-containing protein [Streptomyces sp. NPDC058739]|uniref:amylo-alpha-1,6-glucosidase n=1 Tax=Streptomyces sp. NPDC058739 TaxID=3346618 RepID=UPI003687DE56
MTDRQHLLLYGGTFAAVGDGGDISGVRGGNLPDGVFVRDARHLSRWQLTVDGAVPETLTPVAEGDTARCVLVPRGGRLEPAAYTLFREQAVADSSFVETVRVTSNRPVPTTLRLAITADADFTDQFELRSDYRTYAKPGAVRHRQVLDHGVEFTYQRGAWLSRTTVSAQPAPDAVEETGTGARRMVWTLDLEAYGTAELTLRVVARPHGEKRALRVPASPAAVSGQLLALEGTFVEGVAFPTGWPELAAACARGLADLAALQVPATGPDGEDLRVPAAGAPWFLTLLGRDALLTSLFALPYRPQLAAQTLPALAAAQAGERNAAGSAAQPGKIVHEVRHGELAYFSQVPYGRYYGSVDATPLFLVLLGAYTEQTGDTALARRLESHARAAIGWMLDHGGLTSRGYLVYRADEGGLANQNWKDSPGAICRSDGSRPTGAVMAAGAQGYAYDALRRTSWLARTVWDDQTYAALLEQAAGDLRDRFQRDFWMHDRAFPALALDGAGHQIDALASDAGHLLWSGLLDKEYGELVGRRLLEPDFFSGWGVRTVAAGQPAYHPLSYHRGSVWPHDNALIALGLSRYGLHDEARTVAHALVDAANATGHRLPEVLAGYSREDHAQPVPYPHACTRESRAAATPLALLTAVGGA